MRKSRALAFIAVALAVPVAVTGPSAFAAYNLDYVAGVDLSAGTPITEYGTASQYLYATVENKTNNKTPQGTITFKVYGGTNYGTLLDTKVASGPDVTASGSKLTGRYSFSNSRGVGSYEIRTTFTPSTSDYSAKSSDQTYISVVQRASKATGNAVPGAIAASNTRVVTLSGSADWASATNAPSAKPSSGTLSYTVKQGTASVATATSTLNSSGASNQTVTRNLAPGDYTLETKYVKSGTTDIAETSSVHSTTFTVGNIDTRIVTISWARNSNNEATVAATLESATAGGGWSALSGQTVKFQFYNSAGTQKVGSEFSITPGASGLYRSTAMPVSLDNNTVYTLKVTFAANAPYAASNGELNKKA